MSEYSQGICDDGAAILRDGQPLAIEEILQRLRQRDELLAALKSLEKRASYMAHQCGYYQSDVVELVVARDQIAKCEAQS